MKTRKILGILMTGIVVLGSLTGCGGSDGSGSSEKEPTVNSIARPSLLKDYQANDYQPVTPVLSDYAFDYESAVNKDAFYLSDEQKYLLNQNGFVLVRGYDDEFFATYESNRYEYRANFVTTDAMMHTYHLYFAHLLRSTEMNYLSHDLQNLTSRMSQKAAEYFTALQGTEFEQSAYLNYAFYTVGAALMDPYVEIPAEVMEVVNQELSLVYDASGIAGSPLFGEDNLEDYSQYKPRGYYDTDEGLQRYFRTMMWFGRRNFNQSNEILDRCALLTTLMLKDDETRKDWEEIYTVTSFFSGESDDSGYYEYEPVLEASYGEDVSVESLKDNADGWEKFHQLTAQLTPPQINSIPFSDELSEEEKQQIQLGFRFMGQRFSLDENIFGQLVYDKVKEDAYGNRRMLPDALDVPAAMGSDTALRILEEKGASGYEGYSENMNTMHEKVKSLSSDTWQANLYNGWLGTLNPLLKEKGEGYPSFMKTDAWQRKSLQTYLSSYTELKHDTVLYAKQIMAEMGGGGELITYDDRGYVEAEPEVFYRLTDLVNATRNGLDAYGILSDEERNDLEILASLSSQLQTIAEKELKGELPTDEEFELIRTFGGQLEHFWQNAVKDQAGKEYFTAREFPAAVVVDIATDPNGTCLEVATGKADQIYALVEFDGALHLVSGTAFSFYQFRQPISNRMTDSEWREQLSDYRIDRSSLTEDHWMDDLYGSYGYY